MKALTTSKKKAKGTHRSSRDSKSKVVSVGIANVFAPDQLSEAAKVEWNEIAPTLSDDKLLTGLDKKMLMAYCNEIAKYWNYSKELETKDTILELTNSKGDVINYMTNPLIKLANDALTQATKIGAHFGLTPLSRTKITVPEKENNTPEKQAKNQLQRLREQNKSGKVVQMSKAS